MRAISLFTGAGGLDVGFIEAGVSVVLASEIDEDACNTYSLNHPETTLLRGDVKQFKEVFAQYSGQIDIVFGGPPCQGFSVAGKMDPNDDRSKLIWEFVDVVRIVKPKAFVMENVKALAKLSKWEPVRKQYLATMDSLGYDVRSIVLNSKDYNVPQKRERVFFVGVMSGNDYPIWNLSSIMESYKFTSPTIRDVLCSLPPFGSEGNPDTCQSRITLATNPIMRQSPYAGMYFNGMGRPIDIDGYANTLPASMGGNKTPIIDELYLRDSESGNWVFEYHKMLMDGTIKPEFKEAPSRLRRLSITEAAAIQTFPPDYKFTGPKTAVYKQIGNAVPCNLAKAVAQAVISILNFEDKAVFPARGKYMIKSIEEYRWSILVTTFQN